MTCPELRIAERDAADCPRRDVPCRHCAGKGMCYHGGGDGSYPDPDWCCECGGAAVHALPCLPAGASARIGAVIVGALPHLRHATWPPARSKHPLASVLGMIGALS